MPKVKQQTNKTMAKKEPAGKIAEKKKGALEVSVYSLAGKETATLKLPKEVFGQKVNKSLLAQAMRVYQTNQKNLTASTKGRGEVHGTTAKMYRQKGTGRARHGAKTAPILVGGGIVFGPKPRDVRLSLTKAAKKAALNAAFSTRAAEGKIVALSDLNKASGKTKELISFLHKSGIKSALFLTAEKLDNVVRAVRNIPKTAVLPVNLANAFAILTHETLILTKEAVERLEKPEKS